MKKDSVLNSVGYSSDLCSSLSVTPIGRIRTGMVHKFDAPHQPDGSAERGGVIELYRGRGFEHAIRDLEGFSRIWLLWWFDRNKSWRRLVLPPRGPAKRRGVFATRSPHRPNPLGLTSVELLKSDGLSIYVGSNDLLDETPILDIKPYLPLVDAHRGEKIGWLQKVEEDSLEERYKVTLGEVSSEQINWLRKRWKIDFISRAVQLLGIDPSPHRTRRIMRIREGIYRMACGGWRVYYSWVGGDVQIERIASGYPERMIIDKESYSKLKDRDAHIEFRTVWGALGCGEDEGEI